MQTKYLFKAILLLAVFLVLPHTSSAYKVTDRQVTKLNDALTMYTISYEFGFLNADLWMPMLATEKQTTTNVGYTTPGGKSKAIVLSTAAIEGAMYYVPKGKRAEFTLVVLEETPLVTTKEVKKVRVNALPHIIQKAGDKKVIRNLTPEELVPFTTLK